MVNRANCRGICAPLACVALAAGWVGCNSNPPGEAREALASTAPRQIVALGRLEPAGGILEISAVPGDVLKSFAEGVEEGAQVDAGAELARLESYDLRATQLQAADVKLRLGREQREQELAVARANYQQAVAGKAEVEAKLEEISAQGEALTTLADSAQMAQADYESLAALQASDPELVTERQLQRKQNLANQAVQEHSIRARGHQAALKAAYAAVEAARENVRLAQLNLDLAEKVDRNEVAEIEQKVARETLDQSILRAPPAGDGGSGQFTVLKIFMAPGEFVSQLPVLQIGDLTRMACVAEVYEADVKHIVEGQIATIRSPAFADEFADGDANGSGAGGLQGRVIRIGSLVANAGLIQRNPLAPSDRSVVEVVLEITGNDNEQTARAAAEAARHIGLQVTVQFGEKPPTAGVAGRPKSSDGAPAASREGG